MPQNIEQSTHAQVLDNGDKIKHINEQRQIFDAEDYVDVFNDSIQNYKGLKQKHDQLQDDLDETLGDNEEILNKIHSVLSDEPQDNDVELGPNSISMEDLQLYEELQEKRQQREQIEQQLNRLEEQVEGMRGAVEKVADPEDLESMEIEEVEEPEEASLSTNE